MVRDSDGVLEWFGREESGIDEAEREAEAERVLTWLLEAGIEAETEKAPARPRSPRPRSRSEASEACEVGVVESEALGLRVTPSAPEEEDLGAEADAVLDPAVSVPPFAAEKRAAIQTPVLDRARNAAAVRWNQSNHPAQSGVTPAGIATEIDRYVDPTNVRAALTSYNAANPASPIVAGDPPVDAGFVESVHQFQVKSFVEVGQRDGRAGESTLDSLGLVIRSGLHTVDRPNARSQSRLNNVASKMAALTAGEFTARNWFSHMVNPSFLGRRFSNGVHLVLARKLRVAERHLLSLPAYAAMTPVELGSALGIDEEHKGARPTASSASMHTFGLAVDIKYTGNPWIAGQHVDRDASGPSAAGRVTQAANQNLTRAVNRAALLVSGATLDFTPRYLHDLSRRPTNEAYAELRRRDADLRAYLRLSNDRAALESKLRERQQAGTAGVLQTAEGLAEATARWAAAVHDDLRNLSMGGIRATNSSGQEVEVSQSNFTGRDPRNGFLNLPLDLVVALRDVAGLAWAAIDIGPTESGDVMHFDDRRSAIGAALYRS